ncbi:MAG: hypothetical protein MUO53_09600 [Maribacter sp.]|nr:hypothetical protein [Maribacter sp.]
MINFFNKIHQNLLAEGKTSTYLKYALGEILFYVTQLLDVPDLKTKNEFFPSWEGTKGWVLR